MRLNSDVYDTDFSITYKGNTILVRNEGPEGEKLFINKVLQDHNFGPYNGHLTGQLYDEENNLEVIEVFLGGKQTSDCVINSNGSLLYSPTRAEVQEIPPTKEKTNSRKYHLLFPFLVIVLIALCVVYVLPSLMEKQDSKSMQDTVDQQKNPAASGAAINNQETSDAAIQYIEVNYAWNYGKGTWTYDLQIPKSAYDYYKTIDRAPIRDYSYYVTDASDDEYLEALAQKFKDAAERENYSDLDMVKNIILFVQNLNYVDDKVGTGYDEYPKFPLETLADQGGDCEDSAILLASLLRELGYGTVLIQFTDHMAVGVKGEESLSGSYFEVDGIRYYYVETTSPGWGIGDVPEKMQDQPAKILSVQR